MIKTQHCPNCEATEQKLHDFRQEVSDAVETYFKQENYLGKFNDTLGRFIIPKPKPDPLLEAMKKAGWSDRDIYNAEPSLRAALDALGFEIREKNDDQ
jgi:hypothetical protein